MRNSCCKYDRLLRFTGELLSLYKPDLNGANGANRSASASIGMIPVCASRPNDRPRQTSRNWEYEYRARCLGHHRIITRTEGVRVGRRRVIESRLGPITVRDCILSIPSARRERGRERGEERGESGVGRERQTFDQTGVRTRARDEKRKLYREQKRARERERGKG